MVLSFFSVPLVVCQLRECERLGEKKEFSAETSAGQADSREGRVAQGVCTSRVRSLAHSVQLQGPKLLSWRSDPSEEEPSGDPAGEKAAY